jgi:hypothetical protein
VQRFLYVGYRDGNIFQVVHKFFSPALERFFEEFLEPFLIGDEKLRIRPLDQRNQSRIDHRRGKEGRRRDLEVKLNGKHILEEDGERGIFFSSGLGTEPESEFFLEEKRTCRKKISVFHHLRKQRRGDGIRKVSDQLCLLFLNKIFEIDLKNILFENCQVGKSMSFQIRDQGSVFFDGNDSSSSFYQGKGQSTSSRTDFYDKVLWLWIDDPDNSMENVLISQEMLSQGFSLGFLHVMNVSTGSFSLKTISEIREGVKLIPLQVLQSFLTWVQLWALWIPFFAFHKVLKSFFSG